MNKCKLCGYAWIPRTANTKACPRCKRYDWKEEKASPGGDDKNNKRKGKA